MAADRNFLAADPALKFEQTGHNGIGFFFTERPGNLTQIFMKLYSVSPLTLQSSAIKCNRPPRLFILRVQLLLQLTCLGKFGGITNNSPLTVWVRKPESIPINDTDTFVLENWKILNHLRRSFNFGFLPCQFHPETFLW